MKSKIIKLGLIGLLTFTPINCAKLIKLENITKKPEILCLYFDKKDYIELQAFYGDRIVYRFVDEREDGLITERDTCLDKVLFEAILDKKDDRRWIFFLSKSKYDNERLTNLYLDVIKQEFRNGEEYSKSSKAAKALVDYVRDCIRKYFNSSNISEPMQRFI